MIIYFFNSSLLFFGTITVLRISKIGGNFIKDNYKYLNLKYCRIQCTGLDYIDFSVQLATLHVCDTYVLLWSVNAQLQSTSVQRLQTDFV